MDAWYEGKHVLVTGGTGFIGKVVVESLVRKTRPAAVYLLVRRRRGKSASERVAEAIIGSDIWIWLARTFDGDLRAHLRRVLVRRAACCGRWSCAQWPRAVAVTP